MQGLLKADKCSVQTLLSVMGVEHLGRLGVGWGGGGGKGGLAVNFVGANGTGAKGTIWGERCCFSYFVVDNISN